MATPSSRSKIWARPWGYPEALIILAGILLVGYLWQYIMGPIPAGFYTAPVSIIISVALVVAALYIGLRGSRLYAGRRTPTIVLFVLSPAATLTALGGCLVLLLIMGFCVQAPPTVTAGLSGFLHRSGWSSMVHSYPFNLLYLYLLLILGSISVRRLTRMRWHWQDIGFVLNHVGLFCFLFFALLSGGSMQRYRMVLEEGRIEWRGADYDHGMQLVELPIALKLKEFHMDEYPPQLILLDGKSGQAVKPSKGATALTIDTVPQQGSLSDWQIRVEEYLPLGAPVITQEELVYKPFASSGGAPAVRLQVSRGQEHYSGWVSCGSYLIPYRALALPDSLSIVMPYPEPKQYYSQVEYILKSGGMGEATISVNDPLKTEGWYVYQLNYDQERGRWATTTELELVYDPFIRPVLISIYTLLLGAFFLLLGPGRHTTRTTRSTRTTSHTPTDTPLC